jgi:DNA (cytosine-5)-methyltransferase 1
VKSRRAQSVDDDETWVEGEVNPTLNSFDVGDTRATTAIVEPVLFENSYRDGARIASDGVTQTLTSKMGTGGGNTPMIATAYSVREDAKANTFSATELDHANALSALRPSPQSHHAQMFIAQPMAVRRLTPIECEKLQGWPVDHTRWKPDGTEMADTHRYRMIGNGVASPVAKWVAEQIAKVEYAEG